MYAITVLMRRFGRRTARLKTFRCGTAEGVGDVTITDEMWRAFGSPDELEVQLTPFDTMTPAQDASSTGRTWGHAV